MLDEQASATRGWISFRFDPHIFGDNLPLIVDLLRITKTGGCDLCTEPTALCVCVCECVLMCVQATQALCQPSHPVTSFAEYPESQTLTLRQGKYPKRSLRRPSAHCCATYYSVGTPLLKPIRVKFDTDVYRYVPEKMSFTFARSFLGNKNQTKLWVAYRYSRPDK